MEFAILCHENPQSKVFYVCAEMIDNPDILIWNTVKQAIYRGCDTM